MAYVSEVSPEDRQRLHTIIDQIVNGHAEVGPTSVTRQLIGRVIELAEGGELWADRALAALAVDGARSTVTKRLNEDRSTVLVSHSGAVVSIPSRVGVNAVADDGELERHFQQALWWELPWDRFVRHVQMRRRQHNQLSAQLDAFEEILLLRQQFPDTATPLEACEAAGVDPRSFNLNEEAV